MFDSDFMDDHCLPSPNQLKYKILIKNKKLQSHHSGISLKQRVNFNLYDLYMLQMKLKFEMHMCDTFCYRFLMHINVGL